MEKHIFKFGNSSLAMVLPNKWIKKNALDGSSRVFIDENSKGALVVSANSVLRSTVTKPATRQTKPERLARLVQFHYMWGAGRLVLVSKDGFSETQIRAIQKEITAECPGFEIIGQSKIEMQIEDLTNMKDIDINRIMGRLRSLINQQFQEVLDGNLETVQRLEELVDRFYLLGVRYVNMVQPSDAIQYYRTFLLMETLSDDLVKIVPLHRSNRKIIEMLERSFALSEAAFAGDPKAISESSDVREEALKAIEAAKMDSIYKKIVRECVIKSSHIAEFGLLKEDPNLAIA